MANVKVDPLTKIKNLLGEDTVAELTAMDQPALNKRIAEASEVIVATKEELDAHPEYQELVESKKAFEAGYREVKTRQNAVIKLCLELRK